MFIAATHEMRGGVKDFKTYKNQWSTSKVCRWASIQVPQPKRIGPIEQTTFSSNSIKLFCLINKISHSTNE